MDEILVEEYRGQILECIYRGHICGVSGKGINYQIGDEDFLTFFRSSAKPIQAIPVVVRELKKKYNLTEEELTMLTASHRAEEFHVKALEGIMKKVNVKEQVSIG